MSRGETFVQKLEKLSSIVCVHVFTTWGIEPGNATGTLWCVISVTSVWIEIEFMIVSSTFVNCVLILRCGILEDGFRRGYF